MLCNSLTRNLEKFDPAKPKKVKMYTCGPSIYLLPHIGNYRTFLYEDILNRYLEYLGYAVDRSLNVTDLEDKAIAEAEKENTTLKELTERNTKVFLEELEKLGAKMPSHFPKSSTSVDQAVNIIQALLKKGYAYWHEGNVYFDPLKFKGFGKLYRLDMEKWPKKNRRFHKDTYPGNWWNKGDFILWHGHHGGDQVYWDTRLGKGRPAWNIQDPAMVTQSLGKKVDIYCGGVDNLFRHHDYVKAIMESVTGEGFARFWLHGEHLFVNGKKMSKSRGNIIYPKDLVERGCKWQAIRFFLICGYYRKRLNYTHNKFEKACSHLTDFKDMVKTLQSINTKCKSNRRAKALVTQLRTDFERHMNNDMHLREAFDALSHDITQLTKLAKKGKLSVEDSKAAVERLKEIDEVLKVIF